MDEPQHGSVPGLALEAGLTSDAQASITRAPQTPALGTTTSDGVSRAVDDVPHLPGYRFIEKLGEGGMGSVWRAMQTSTHREVAMKLMHGAGPLSEHARGRFDREVELSARMAHPHIARVYDSGLHRGTCYYVMELIEGQPLDAYATAHRLAPRQIFQLMLPICEALQHAHQRGVIHRDLKPSNIVVSDDGMPHMLDFGLAKLMEQTSPMELTLDGAVMGTLAYMAPEQAAGHLDQIDTRTDIYALGMILFRLLTGGSPYSLAGSQQQVIERVCQNRITAPMSNVSTPRRASARAGPAWRG